MSDGRKRSPSPGQGEPDGGAKKPRLEEPVQQQDPGKKNYHKMKLLLKQLTALVERTDKTEEMLERITNLANDLVSLVETSTPDGETPNPVKLLQAHLKCTLFNAEAIKDGDNIKTFLNGLEDCSAVKSDDDDSVYVFLANYATELWYQWDEEACGWKWTPEADFSIWMPCSSLVVSAGGWKGETPAPENQLIIDYLDAVRPVPSDEQHLPSFCDVAKLLQQLAGLGEGLAEVARTIARAVLDFDVVNRDSKSVRKALEKLEVFVGQSPKVEGEGEGSKEGGEPDAKETGGGGKEAEVIEEGERADVESGGEIAEVDGGGKGSGEGGEEKEGAGVKVSGGEENGEGAGKDKAEEAGEEGHDESEAIRSGGAEENGDERGG